MKMKMFSRQSVVSDEWSSEGAVLADAHLSKVQGSAAEGGLFWRAKRGVDVVASLGGVLPLCAIALALSVLNPFFNPGPLIYRQPRMGRGGAPFTIWKFRTMRCAPSRARGALDDVERDRVTRLGAWLRRTRIDETPQLINILSGDMSLIGPRPDYLPHAEHFCETVPGYRLRHVVRPGISGLAQVTLGYAAGHEAFALKARADLEYIRSAGWRLEAWIWWRTIVTVVTGAGAR